MAAVCGDREALELLVAELLPRVRNLVRYLVRGDADVDDIAREALVTIVRGLPGRRGEGALRAWADEVTRRVVLARLRRGCWADTPADEEPDLAAIPDPEGHSSDYTDRRRAVSLLDRLPHHLRLVLVMHHVLGRSATDIARDLGVPFETVHSRLSLGMARLQSLQTPVRR